MVKTENPYSKLLDEISEASQLHRIEGNRIKRDMLETKLEDSVKKYANNPLIAEIKAQKHISEDDQGFIDMNMFSTTFYKTKLDLAHEFEKEIKKFDECASIYKSLVQQRITKFNLNASILSKFTPEEIRKNPKLSKMSNDLPDGYDNAHKKFIRQDALVSNIYAKYISKNGEEYAEKLFKFLNESKQFRKEFIAMKQAEVDSLKTSVSEVKKEETTKKTVIKKLFGKSQGDFDVLRGLILEEDKCNEEQLNELKSYISKVLSAKQLGAFTKVEGELSIEYEKLNSVEGIIAKRLKDSLAQFQKGVDKLEDLITETGLIENFYISLKELIDEEAYGKDVIELKHDTSKINVLVGYTARLKTYINEKSKLTKKRLFGNRTNNPIFDKIVEIYDDFVKFLVEKVGMDSSLFTSEMLDTMITDDKKDELAYALMNNAMSISGNTEILNWQDELNKILGHCILDMIGALEREEDPIAIVDKYREQYGPKEKEVVEVKPVEERKVKRTFATTQEQKDKIKNILR